MNTEHNFIENEIMILSKETMDLFFEHDDPSALIALYLAYYYVAKWQKTNQIKASISYTAKQLHWGEKKVRHHKQQLVALGLIEDVKHIDKSTKKVKGWYIKIKYLWKKENVDKVIHNDSENTENHPSQNGQGGEKASLKTTLAISHTVVSDHPNALSVNNRNALSAVNGVVKGGKNAATAVAGAGTDTLPDLQESTAIHAGNTLLRDLPDLAIEDGEKLNTIREIRAVLGPDEEAKSLKYWNLVVSKIQPESVLQILAEVKVEAIHRGKLFSYKIEQHVLTKRLSTSYLPTFVGA